MSRTDFHEIFEGAESVLFDLDNTVYDEWSFLSAKYREVSKYVHDTVGLKPSVSFDFLVSRFRKNGRSNIFDDYLNEFNLIGRVSLSDLLKIMRSPVQGDLFLFSYFVCLQDFYSNFVIVTNGNVDQQKNKVFSLFGIGLKPLCIYANQFEPKPSRLSFEYLSKIYPVSRPIFIGDSLCDQEYAAACKIPFFRIDFERDEYGFTLQETISFSRG